MLACALRPNVADITPLGPRTALSLSFFAISPVTFNPSVAIRLDLGGFWALEALSSPSSPSFLSILMVHMVDAISEDF